jgi:hypothetical protein
VGSFILFYLMKIVLGIAITIIGMMAVCLTCCMAAIPYLGTVILLPLIVFARCYPLCFLEQFGPQWRILWEPDTYKCPKCRYDLHGNQGAVQCPECGAEVDWGFFAVPPVP